MTNITNIKDSYHKSVANKCLGWRAEDCSARSPARYNGGLIRANPLTPPPRRPRLGLPCGGGTCWSSWLTT